jgi:hypothetical protein
MVFTFFKALDESGDPLLDDDGRPLNTLACSHTSLSGVQSSRSVVLEYLDRKRGDYITWYHRSDPLQKFPYRFYNHHYCDNVIGPGGSFERQENCNFQLEAGPQPYWLGDANQGCEATQGSFPRPPQIRTYADSGFNYCGITPENYGCNQMIDLSLNEYSGDLRKGKQNLIDQLGAIGCDVRVVQGRTSSNCIFKETTPGSAKYAEGYYAPGTQSYYTANEWIQTDEAPKVLGWGNINAYVRKDITFAQTCSIAPNGSDPIYKPFCCALHSLADQLRVSGAAGPSFTTLSNGNLEQVPQINPITNKPFTGKECDETWCITDPLGYCSDMFVEGCRGTSTCNRHNFLSRYSPPPVRGTNSVKSSLLVNQVSITGIVGGIGSAVGGITGVPLFGYACNSYYNLTKLVAQNKNNFFGSANGGPTSAAMNAAAQLRVGKVQLEVSLYCTDPASRGSGECACLRGYQSLGADFLNSIQGESSLTFFSKPTAVRDSSRRVDLFCDPRQLQGQFGSNDLSEAPQSFNNTSFTGLSSYTDDTVAPFTYTTFSNPCTSFTEVGGQTTGYPPLLDDDGEDITIQYPTLNPMNSVRQQLNYGDIAKRKAFNQSQLPYRCWLPACTNPSTYESVFGDLLTANVQCPSVCYAYSGASTINVSNIDANVLSMGNFMQQCNFPGNKPQNFNSPFLLPGNVVRGFQIDVPQDYQGQMIIDVINPEIDSSQFAASKTMFVATELPGIIDVHIGAVGTQSTIIYKYSLSAFETEALGKDRVFLTLTVDTSNQNVKYFQTNLWLSDDLRGVQSIPITLNIHSSFTNPDMEAAWPQSCYLRETLSDELITEYVCDPVDCSFGSNSYLSNQDGCTVPSDGQYLGAPYQSPPGFVGSQKYNKTASAYRTLFKQHIQSNSNLRATSFFSNDNQDNVPLALQFHETQGLTSVPQFSDNSLLDNGLGFLRSLSLVYGATLTLLSETQLFPRLA